MPCTHEAFYASEGLDLQRIYDKNDDTGECLPCPDCGVTVSASYDLDDMVVVFHELRDDGSCGARLRSWVPDGTYVYRAGQWVPHF
jgi:hypothetical protein